MSWPPYLLLLVLGSIFCEARKCPPEEELKPHCWCYNYEEGGSVFCQNFNSPAEVELAAEACRGYNVTSFSVYNSTLTYLPQDVFAGTVIAKISLYNTVLMSLSNGPLAFQGLEDTMVELRAYQAEYAARWKLGQLRKLQKIELIDISNILLEDIDDEFLHFPRLRFLGLSRTDVSYIGNDAFASCPKLNILHLSDNKINQMKRSMLPKPATDLQILRLDGNELSSFPDDFFTEMPKLIQVSLLRNKFLTVSESSFGRVLDQLEVFELLGNPLHCDCRMSWIVSRKKPQEFNARCVEPPSLKDTLLKYLSARDLFC